MGAPAGSLTGAALFEGLPTADLEALTQLAECQQVEKGGRIFGLGDEARCFYVVRQGAVVLTMPIEVLGQQQETFAEEVKPGGVFGWSALVSPHHYTMGARANEPVELLALEGTRVREFLATRLEAQAIFLDNLSRLICRRLLAMQAMWLRELHRNLSTRLSSPG